MNNISKERVNADIYRAISGILITRVSNPAFAGVSVLRTELSADGGVCHIFVMGGLDDFKKAAGFFGTEIARVVNLRRMPKLSFIVDKGQDNADRVEVLLNEIRNVRK